MTLSRATDPATSHKAAQKKPDVKAHILAAFDRRPVKGWTDFELEQEITAKTGVSPQRVRTARAELTSWATIPYVRSGPIRPRVGVFRKTERGFDAQVYVLA